VEEIPRRENMNSCFVCGKAADIQTRANQAVYDVKCNKCGKYSATNTVAGLNISSRPNSQILSGVIRQRTENDEITPLHSANIEQLIELASKPKNPVEAIDKILLYILKHSESAEKFINLVPENDCSLVYSRSGEEFIYYVDKALQIEYLEDDDVITTGYRVRLSLSGWKRVSEMETQKRDYNQVFVAMWFNKDLDDVWKNGFKLALADVGFDPVRIDIVEHNEKICDRIVAEIRRSGLLVADFTGNRGGVYFESGFAMGLGIPVIWTCRADCVKELHFDTRQYNHIEWNDDSDLYEKLITRIEATIPGRVRKKPLKP